MVELPVMECIYCHESEFETYQALQRIADQGTPLAVKTFVTSTVQRWKEDKFTLHKNTARMLAQDFLMNGIRRIEKNRRG